MLYRVTPNTEAHSALETGRVDPSFLRVLSFQRGLDHRIERWEAALNDFVYVQVLVSYARAQLYS